MQDFREIIGGGYKYIDKTEYVHRLCSSGIGVNFSSQSKNLAWMFFLWLIYIL